MTASRDRWIYPSIAAVLYFSQGFPFGIFQELFGTYLRAVGIGLDDIGYINSVALAWTLKFAWAPAVDLFGTYRRWIAGAVIAIAAALIAIGVFGASEWTVFVIAATLLAAGSATQDIAIDATTVRITPANLLGPINSVRVAAYRIGMMAAGGGVAVLGSFYGWRIAFFAAAATMIALMVAIMFLPRVNESDLRPGDLSVAPAPSPASSSTGMPRGENRAARRENPFRGLWQWLRRPRAVWILVFILLYKMGDSALLPMIRPYWIDRGYTAAEVGTVTTMVGVWFIVAGAVLGGIFVARFGIFKGLLWLGVSQILSNVFYAMIATAGAPRATLYATAMVESFTYGLGTAAFLAFLMSVCDREHAATEFAMLTAIFALTRTIVATFSGVATEQMGYAGYFWLTVFLGVPSLLLLPLIRAQIRDAEAEAPGVAAVMES